MAAPTFDGPDAVADFLSEVAAVEEAYQPYATLSYFAVRQGSDFVLVKARISLNLRPSDRPVIHVETHNIQAGTCQLADLNADIFDITTSILEGTLPTLSGPINFPVSPDTKAYAVEHIPFHDEGQQARLGVLTIRGARPPRNLRSPSLDWELRAAAEPYDGLRDLLQEHPVGLLEDDCTAVEVISYAAVRVDQSSSVTGTSAKPAVLISKHLDRTKARLGYRLITQGRTVTRASIYGDRMTWTELDDCFRGHIEIEIPEGALVHCIASYNHSAAHHYYIVDPTTAPNPRRVVLQKLDSGLAVLNDFLMKSGEGRRDARDLETGIAWLAWMCGFSVLHLGMTDRTQDAADLILNTPQGHFVVVECTTGMLKTDKVALLLARTNEVKSTLLASGHGHLRTLPLMVTTKQRADVLTDAAAAERAGVGVLTLEDLRYTVERSLVLRDPEQLFRELQGRLSAAVVGIAEAPPRA